MSLNYGLADSKNSISKEKSAPKPEWKISVQMYALVKKTNTSENRVKTKNSAPIKPELKNTDVENQ